MLDTASRAETLAAAGRPFGKLAVLLQRLGFRRQVLVIAHDVAIALTALPIAFLLRDSNLTISAYRVGHVSGMLPLLAATALLTILALGSYRSVWRYMAIPEIVSLARFAAMTVLLFHLGQFLVDRLQGMPRSIPLLQFLVMMFLMLTSRITYGAWLRWTESVPAATPAKPILLVGSGDGAALLIRMLGFRRTPEFEPIGIICDQITTNRSIAGVPVLGNLADFDRVVANLRVQGTPPAQLVITRPHHELGPNAELGYAAADAVIERARAAGIEVADLPDLMRFRDDPSTTAPAAADGLATDVYPRLKRAFDVVVSLAVLAFFSPLIAIAAAAVAAFIQRPVMFVQRRPGRGRKPFKLYKFRTMRDPVDRHGRLLTDAERTPLAGRILRRSRLDELPQFWNVLIGDMAIIGPRPLLRADLDAMPDRGEARSRTRPGITGWAQVNGGHQLTLDEKQALDAWYAQNASLALDLRIIWRTITMMLMGERRDDHAIGTALAGVAAE